MKAYRSRYTYLLTIEAECHIIADELPAAKHIFEALRHLLCENEERAYISDSFPAGFIIKPMYYDTAKLSSAEDFNLFKKIKRAKYEESDLVTRDIRPEKIPQMIREQRIIADGEYIYSASKGPCESFPRYVDPARERPVVMKIKKGDLLEFYLSAKNPLDDLQGKKLSLLKGKFCICRIEKRDIKSTERFMLTADLETSTVKTDSAKIFRLRYSKKENKQYFVRGSIFSSEVFSDMEETAMQYAPFLFPV